MKYLVTLILAIAPSIGSAQDLKFDSSHTVNCIANSPWQVAECIGASANVCMSATDIGGTTVGMGACLAKELAFWDAQLNANYKSLRAIEQHQDAGLSSASGYVNQAKALRDMQRSWIDFRDLTCEYERAQWAGGTGGGPAAVGCLMRMTAEQALYLSKIQSDN